VDRATWLYAVVAFVILGIAALTPGTRLLLACLAAFPAVLAARRLRIPGTSAGSRSLWVFAVLALFPALDGESWLALSGPAILLAAILALVLRVETPKTRAIGCAAIAVAVAAVPAVAFLGLGLMGVAHSTGGDRSAATAQIFAISALPIIAAIAFAVARAGRGARLTAAITGVVTIPVAFGLMLLGLELSIQSVTYVNTLDVPVSISWERAGPADRSLSELSLEPHETYSASRYAIRGSGLRIIATDSAGRTVLDHRYSWLDLKQMGGQVVIR
jgi:hypothetical protein